MTYFDSVDDIQQEQPGNPKGQWQNWSQNQTSFPQEVLEPVSTSELTAELQSTTTPFRLVGSGHSFTPLAKTADTLISLHHMTGLLGYDEETNTARIKAGTPLHQLSPLLDEINQGMLNMGDINHQSLAGAIATGTHGTGAKLPCLSGLVKSLTLISPQGKVLECSAHHNKELFDAARVNLGALGVVTEIELQNRPAYSLKESIELQPLEDVLNNLDTLKAQNRHVEFFALAYSDQVILKTLNPTQESAFSPKAPLIAEDTLLRFFCELTRHFPKLIPFVHRQLASFVKPSQRVDLSHKVFATPRTVRFNEMEYQVPAEDGPTCLRKLIQHLRKHNVAAFFPIEYRYVAADDIWMSPFYDRDSASISIHQYYKQDYSVLFQQLEPIFDQFEGRPHWGKTHTKNHLQLAKLYPKWKQWQNIRRTLDPTQRLMNDDMTTILGDVDASA
ncbi:D-arabinono-1,4-lactone oxidase [Litoribrevibacter albus]|uniref:Oxidoreductase n=1 Tax=Litoribrevibacter albus TaxID=1473156 RepID=A0AA37W7S9_9GAMM|nr:D-arabinono-1,4-lactone oxidase [Litoribrevibacter albus]GLQ33085.1 oxidoreductase [Litoribrevibacter albus]